MFRRPPELQHRQPLPQSETKIPASYPEKPPVNHDPTLSSQEILNQSLRQNQPKKY